MPNKFILAIALILSSLFFSQTILATDANKQIEHILSLKQSPTGVVFEVVTGTANSLEWALPKIQKIIKKLRSRFPKLDIAIVTHGDEQFALKTTNNKKKFIRSHSNSYKKKIFLSMFVEPTQAGRMSVRKSFPTMLM